MRIGVGLPAAVPGTASGAVGDWAAESERLGFESLSVLDRLVYDNLDPLIALAVAADRTERLQLLTTVLTVPYRRNPVVLAKQLASIDRLSDGRLVPGLALGGWPDDYAASEAPTKGRGAAFDAMLATMRRAWDGRVAGDSGSIPALPAGHPPLLLGGLVPAAYARAARVAEGWVAPFFGHQLLVDGIAGAAEAWDEAGRRDEPRIVAVRYFSLGAEGGAIADEYLMHYYGADYFADARADTSTTPEELRAEVARVADAGADDLLLFPCSGDLEQLSMLADALRPG
jgi:alkanesulfonate monooxygenase SsuD/methylene tetrahydromethanopterin reductase-like flavin-dependent oxidoreductase (luciferase family)